MNRPMQDVPWGLTEKEKQTLRLIVRGHDAKSIARDLDLSVHTIHERLRNVRRKMAVSSSREAARLLLEAEGGGAGAPAPAPAAAPKSFGDTEMGEDAAGPDGDQESAPALGAGWGFRSPRILTGVLLMTLTLGLLALATLPQVTATPDTAPVAPAAAPHSDAADLARQWLALLDQGRWGESYEATGASFQTQNTARAWAAASNAGRVPLGAVISRTLISEEDVPAPPFGYRVVKFRTSFAHKADAVETVTFDREDGAWRVEGVTIE